jgi:hypothetical protein
MPLIVTIGLSRQQCRPSRSLTGCETLSRQRLEGRAPVVEGGGVLTGRDSRDIRDQRVGSERRQALHAA